MQGRLLQQAFPDVPRKESAVVGRVAVDMIYAAVEMLFDVSLNTRSVAQVVAGMLASRLERLYAHSC